MDLLTLTALHARLGYKAEQVERIVQSLDNSATQLARLLLQAEKDAVSELVNRRQQTAQRELSSEEREVASTELRRALRLEIKRLFREELVRLPQRVTLDSVDRETRATE